jgi:hypothetical protein
VRRRTLGGASGPRIRVADWSVELVENGGLKHIHRLMATLATYACHLRRAGRSTQARAIRLTTTMLWKPTPAARRRGDSRRDTANSGELNLEMHGPHGPPCRRA